MMEFINGGWHNDIEYGKVQFFKEAMEACKNKISET